MRPWAILPLLLLLPLLMGQAAPDWRRDWASLQKASESVSSVQAQFEQTKELAILKKPLRSTGRLIFVAPDSLRWEYTEPVGSVLLLKAEEAKRFIRREGRWLPDASGRVEAMQLVLGEIRLWLAGRYEDSKNFKAQLLAEPSPRVHLEARSPELAKIIQAIDLVLDERAGQLSRVEIFEGPQAKTVLNFSAVRLNETVDPGLFLKP